jgi:hypothetical protein
MNRSDFIRSCLAAAITASTLLTAHAQTKPAGTKATLIKVHPKWDLCVEYA